jgi:hypothetical protein
MNCITRCPPPGKPNQYPEADYLRMLDRSLRQGLTGVAVPGQKRVRLLRSVPSLPIGGKGAGPCPPTSPLINWTDQGIKNFRDTVRRAEDFQGLVQRNGGQVRQIVWTLGEYDVVGVVDFPDDETATVTLLPAWRAWQRPDKDHESVRRRADDRHHSAHGLNSTSGQGFRAPHPTRRCEQGPVECREHGTAGPFGTAPELLTVGGMP